MAAHESRAELRHGSGAFDIVAIAASAGGLAAIREVLAALPASFPAAIAVVQHLDPHHPSMLASILDRQTALHVQEAHEGDSIESGTVYVASPNYHLLVNPDGTFTLTQTELVHFVRPSADLLFESAAATYRTRAIAVVLTGSGSDGNMGVQAIKKTGGVVIIQDPTTSEFSSMPAAAEQTGAVDWVLRLQDIAPRLVALVNGKRRM